MRDSINKEEVKSATRIIESSISDAKDAIGTIVNLVETCYEKTNLGRLEAVKLCYAKVNEVITKFDENTKDNVLALNKFIKAWDEEMNKGGSKSLA